MARGDRSNGNGRDWFVSLSRVSAILGVIFATGGVYLQVRINRDDIQDHETRIRHLERDNNIDAGRRERGPQP